MYSGEIKKLHSYMKRDFPFLERWPYFMAKRFYKNKIFNGLFLAENSDIGYAVISALEDSGYALINYFAILPEYRSKGYGSEFLKLLINHYPNHALVLEVENPSVAKNARLRDIAEKRIIFYKNAEFHVVPGIKLKLFGTDMLIMTNAEIEHFDARKIMHSLYQPMLKSDLLRQIVVNVTPYHPAANQ